MSSEAESSQTGDAAPEAGSVESDTPGSAGADW